MSFNFDETVNRADSDCAKWNYYGKDVIPMWVADMDFKAAPPILRALHERVEHGVFGYEFPQQKMSDVIVNWVGKRYGWKITAEDVILTPGLVSGLNVVSRATGRIGDTAITITPTYFPFMSAPQNQGLAVTKVQLKPAHTADQLHYDIDFEAFEKAITPRTSLFIHCHPHNPVGREFTDEENRRLAEICIKHNVTICSDEIWCDLTLPGTKHTPLAALSEEIAQNTITLMAPSKSFNLPGLGCSYMIVQNKQLRQQVLSAKDGIIPFVNALGLTACHAAYTEGEPWLLALQQYLAENRDVARDYIAENMPEIKTTNPDSTYLLWLDCNQAGINGNPYTFFMDKAKVALGNGPQFGPGGEGFVRLNFGCPRSQLIEALDRMRGAMKRA
jgi:cystathionine beta-lyase